MQLPNPGSKEALDMGCECPILDNSHGRGYLGMEGVYVYNLECPLHKNLLTKTQESIESKHDN